MSEVPGSLTELKIQIGKDIYLHVLETTYGSADAYWDAMDQVPDQFYIETAEEWRTKHPDVVEKFGRVAEGALLELPKDQEAAVATLLMDMLKYGTDLVVANLDTEAFYTFAILNGVMGADHANARQYFDALTAYCRGE